MARLSLLSMLVCLIGFTTAFVAPGAALRLSTQQPAAAAAVTMMAKAPTKPMRVNQRNYLYNKGYRSEMRTRIKRVSLAAARFFPFCLLALPHTRETRSRFSYG